MRNINFTPARPPRACTPGEGIFLEAWKSLMADEPSVAAEIMAPVAHMGISSTIFGTVSSSLMVYLGCNGGRALIHECEAAAQACRSSYPAAGYLQAWALHNQRCRGSNHGLRAMEYILAPEALKEHQKTSSGLSPGKIRWDRVPVVTQDEYDVMEMLLHWLASPQGRTFAAENRVKADAASRARLASLSQ